MLEKEIKNEKLKNEKIINQLKIKIGKEKLKLILLKYQ